MLFYNLNKHSEKVDFKHRTQKIERQFGNRTGFQQMTNQRQRLYINIDHIATVRQARRGAEPTPADAVAFVL